MKFNRIKKYQITLLEVMIVIFLIGLISAVVGYNMKGSLDRGREFKTKQSMQQVRNILLLEIENGYEFTDIQKEAEKILEHSKLVNDPKSLLKDGWNENFAITYKNGDIQIKSKKYDQFLKKQKKPTKEKSFDEDLDEEIEY